MILSGNDYLAKEKGSKAALKNKSNHTNINKNSQVPKTAKMLEKSEGDPVLSKTNSSKVQENIFLQYHFSSALILFKTYF